MGVSAMRASMQRERASLMQKTKPRVEVFVAPIDERFSGAAEKSCSMRVSFSAGPSSPGALSSRL